MSFFKNLFHFKKINQELFACDIGIIANYNDKNFKQCVYHLLTHANDKAISVLGIGNIGFINTPIFKAVITEYVKNNSKYPNIKNIYPTITCILDHVLINNNVIAKIILNTKDSKILDQIDKYLIGYYKNNRIPIDKLEINSKALYDILLFINYELEIAIEIWAFTSLKNYVCQLESKDMQRIPESFLGHCFHDFIRKDIRLGSNCEAWEFYPSNDKDSIDTSIKFYCLLNNDDIFK